MVKVREDLTGRKFGRLTVLEQAEDYVSPKGTHCTRWLCECSCKNHNKIIVNGYALRRGETKSCGCLKNNKYEDIRLYNQEYHKDVDFTRLLKIWNDMYRRCNKPTHKRYDDYGGRGITVCEEWNNSFEEFYYWAISNGYNNSLTIDRIDNDKGYSPNNCKWSTYEEQANNKRSCHYITYNGETHTIKEWGKINNINPTTIRTRIHAGWNEIDAITL